jgi:transposase-like protein
MVCNNVCYGSSLYTDEFAAYNELKRHGFMHEHVNHYQKEYARRGDIHVNNCECRSNIYQLWVSKFMV